MAAEVRIESGTPEARLVYEQVQRAVRLRAELNQLPYADLAAIRRAWSELTGQAVDDTFHLIPPVWSEQGSNVPAGGRL